ncbi:MAG: restriction endonuclease subunit S [Halobacteriota archaeon]|nr:restriction endonuclease subunit S [Halobacteriota archaeon]
MKQYPSYKDSGIEWLGEIPEGWDAKKFRRVSRLKQGLQIAQSERFYEAGDDRYEYITIKSIHAKNNNNSKEYIEGPPPNVRCNKNDVLLARTGATGEVITDVYGVFHNNFFRIDFDRTAILRDFLVYYLRNPLIYQHLIVLAGTTTIPDLNHNDFLETLFLYPSPNEQREIVKFLDRQTGQIDELIEKKERQIELLKEKRAALISHAVTKGLDPDVPMKDSGIEWLGEIPEGWEAIRVKLIEGNDTSVVQTGPFGAQLHASDYLDEGVPLILICNVRDLKIDETDIPRISKEDAERLFKYRLNVGDIVFSRVGSIGRIALCTEREKGWLISGQMLRLRIQNPIIDNKFSLYSFSSKCLLTFVEIQSVGSTRESINTDILRNIPILLPPLTEQHAIADFLDRETGRIDQLSAKVQESIEKLREYRTALISAAVTGKIDVRGEVLS